MKFVWTKIQVPTCTGPFANLIWCLLKSSPPWTPRLTLEDVSKTGGCQEKRYYAKDVSKRWTKLISLLTTSCMTSRTRVHHLTRVTLRVTSLTSKTSGSKSWVCQILNFKNRTNISRDTAIFVKPCESSEFSFKLYCKFLCWCIGRRWRCGGGQYFTA